MKTYYVYILTNKPRGVLYIGITNNLERRALEHQLKQDRSSFSATYNTDKLVYFEETGSVDDAIQREKQLKNWHREWKINLIESKNSTWDNLFDMSDGILKQVQDDNEERVI